MKVRKVRGGWMITDGTGRNLWMNRHGVVAGASREGDRPDLNNLPDLDTRNRVERAVINAGYHYRYTGNGEILFSQRKGETA